MKNNQALALFMQLPMQSIRAKNAQKKRLAERTLMRMKMLCAYSKSKVRETKTEAPVITIR